MNDLTPPREQISKAISEHNTVSPEREQTAVIYHSLSEKLHDVEHLH